MKKKGAIYFIFIFIFSFIFFLIGNRAAFIFLSSSGTYLENISSLLSNLFISLKGKPFFVSLEQLPIMVGIGAVLSFVCILLYNSFVRKNNFYGKEHGSAEWSSVDTFKPLRAKSAMNNMLLGSTVNISLNTRKTKLNNNILVCGGSGSGKTRFFLLPNLLQMHTSFVITDPKGTVLPDVYNLLINHGYKVRYFNTKDLSISMHYNPLKYIQSEVDILRIVKTLIANTSDKQQKKDFWVDAEALLYNALIGYVYYEALEEEKNLCSVIKLFQAMDVQENNENFLDPVDIIFKELEEREPNHFAVTQYKKYKKAAGKTAKSILISCGARLAPFDVNEVNDLLSYDELSLDTIGDEKTVLFLNTDDTDSTLDFLVGMILTQMFTVLCNKADTKYGGRLPIHVRILADEIMNICQIPNLEKLIAVIRSREISLCPIIQNFSQVKATYKDDAGTIIGNCNSLLFLGSDETETTKEISGRIGKTTVAFNAEGTSKGSSSSFSSSQQLIARDLMSPDEVAVMPNDECIVFVKGYRAWKGKKFDLLKHPLYKEMEETKKSFKYPSKGQVEAQSFFANVKEVINISEDVVNELNSLVADQNVV